jgi:bacterioferritin B
MTQKSFAEGLVEQVGHEFSAHQQYVAIAVHYDGETLPRLAGFYYRQALEERNHAMMIIQYLLDADLPVSIPALEAPRTEFADIVAPVALALEQERRVTGQINALASRARSEGDFQGEQFMQWFIKEQIEEVATATDLLRVVERARENPLLAEEYLARESLGETGNDPTAPSAAGGAV